MAVIFLDMLFFAKVDPYAHSIHDVVIVVSRTGRITSPIPLPMPSPIPSQIPLPIATGSIQIPTFGVTGHGDMQGFDSSSPAFLH